MSDIETRLAATLRARSSDGPGADAVLDGLDRRLTTNRDASTSPTRRRLLTPLLAFAAVAAVVVGSIVWFDRDRGADDDAAPPIAGGGELPASIQPPPGYRLVGLDGVAVAVPESWATNDVKCGFPQSDTVVTYIGPGIRLCQAHVPDTSAVVVRPASTLAGAGRRYDEVVEVGGFRVGITAVTSGYDGGEFEQSLVVEDRNVAFTVVGDAAGAGLVQRLLESLVALPRGYVAVPAAPRPEAVTTLAEEAGLVVETEQVDLLGWSEGVLIRSEPALGSVLPVGSTVTLHVTSGGPAERIEVTMGHCWLEPVEFAKKSWNLPYDQQFGWGGWHPDSWIGTGAITLVGPKEARYVDDGGKVLPLIPANLPAAELGGCD